MPVKVPVIKAIVQYRVQSILLSHWTRRRSDTLYPVKLASG